MASSRRRLSSATTNDEDPMSPTHDDPNTPEPNASGQEGELDLEKASRLQEWKGYLHDVARENTGLLLLVLSMAFFSMMDAAVIKLHKIDPPVTTLQV